MKRSTESKLLYVAAITLTFTAFLFVLIKGHPAAVLLTALLAVVVSARLTYLRVQRRKEQLAKKNQLIEELSKLRN